MLTTLAGGEIDRMFLGSRAAMAPRFLTMQPTLDYVPFFFWKPNGPAVVTPGSSLVRSALGKALAFSVQHCIGPVVLNCSTNW